MKTLPIVLSCLILLSCDKQSGELQNKDRDTIINGHKYSPTLIELDKHNRDGLIIMGTPTFDKLNDDQTIKSDILHLKLEKPLTDPELGVVKYSFSKDTLTISEHFFRHGEYFFLPFYSKTDSSIFIDLHEGVFVDTTYFKETNQPSMVDITIAHDAILVTKLFINDSDRSKSIYYKGKKISK